MDDVNQDKSVMIDTQSQDFGHRAVIAFNAKTLPHAPGIRFADSAFLADSEAFSDKVQMCSKNEDFILARSIYSAFWCYVVDDPIRPLLTPSIENLRSTTDINFMK